MPLITPTPTTWDIAAWNRLTVALQGRDDLELSRAVDVLRRQGFKYRTMLDHARSALGMSAADFDARMADADDAAGAED